MSEGNNNQWFIWLVVISVVGVTLIAFNYSSKNAEMSDIFSDEELGEAPVEYEFVDTDMAAKPAAPAAQPFTSQKPAMAQMPATASAPVRTAAAPASAPAPAQPTAVAQAPAGGNYAIQVVASKSKERLEVDLRAAKEKGFPAYMITKELGSGTWHRIYIGSFETKSQADAYLPKVRQVYKDGFVISVK